ncbi:HD domain-containing protein [Patescibacteria group bacterium]|nr:HD domain-containing protein [Patescibacteria group bacterium]
MNNFLSYEKNKQGLLNKIKLFSKGQQDNIKKAMEVAEHYHTGQIRDQKRDDGGVTKAKYVIHCVRAALWLIQEGVNDINIIIATILHDSLEDTSITEKEIKKLFGDDVLKLVVGVTRPRANNETEADKLTTKPANYQKILNSDGRIRLIKTADLLDNMRSWIYLPDDHPFQKKIPRWLQEAENYSLPLAESVNQNAAQEMNKILNNYLPKN